MIKNIIYGFFYTLTILIIVICFAITFTHILGWHDHGNIRRNAYEENIFIPSGKKLRSITNDKAEFWLLISDMKSEEKPEEYLLYNPESILTRKVYIYESRIH